MLYGGEDGNGRGERGWRRHCGARTSTEDLGHDLRRAIARRCLQPLLELERLPPCAPLRKVEPAYPFGRWRNLALIGAPLLGATTCAMAVLSCLICARDIAPISMP